MIDAKDKNSEKPLSRGSYPADYRKNGDGEERFKIFISELVLEDIKTYLSSDKAKELGGVVLGEVYHDENEEKFIIINEFVIARFTEADETKLTFTHKTWEYMNNKIDKEYQGKKVVGWFHSHPGHTVFLSSYDKFIHENFFTQDFAVAYVYDPLNNEEGFFFQKNNLLVRASCFYVYSDYQIKKEKINILNNNINLGKKTKKNNLLFYTVLIISVLSLILSVVLLIKHFELSDKVADVKDINSKIKELKEENVKTNSKIDKFIRSLESDADSNKAGSNSSLIKYQIKPGDTLRKLAVAYYKDEGKYNLLIRYNNLKDENDIAVGQIIGIPTEK
jgi:proteasome lid subunit RPN8/RPN11/LysM repeat protein